MRIIAGAYKGTKLISPVGGDIRPTADRVKEAMFGALQFDIPGAKALDAFAGSGALGIEALSRGAAHVDFAENNPGCFKTLEKNLGLIKTANYGVIKGDVLKADGLCGYDIVFLDPPYGDGLYIPFLNMASERGIMNKGCKIALECRRMFDFMPPKEYNLIKKKGYGDVALWFLEYGE